MTTLITGEEIKEYCGLSPNFPSIDLRSCKGVEHYFFFKHLTLDIYNKLLSSLINYSDVIEWVGTTSYNIGDTTKRGNKVYIAIESNTNLRPPNNKWDIAPKLYLDITDSDAACINAIWCDGFLAETLSWAVLVARLPFIISKIEVDGVGTTVNDKFIKADINELKIVQGGAQRMYDMCLGNLKTFLDINKCFQVWTENQCSVESKKVLEDYYLIG